MNAAVWLMLSGLLYSLQLSSGSFPRPLTAQEEQHYLALAAQGDLDARNVLIERNLRLVAHIMNKCYPKRRVEKRPTISQVDAADCPIVGDHLRKVQGGRRFVLEIQWTSLL